MKALQAKGIYNSLFIIKLILDYMAFDYFLGYEIEQITYLQGPFTNYMIKEKEFDQIFTLLKMWRYLFLLLLGILSPGLNALAFLVSCLGCTE